jgi:aldehyde dehydrogenase (NAD+)
MEDLQRIFEHMEYGLALENASAAHAWLDEHQRRFGLWINGAWHADALAKTFLTENPATGEPLATCTQASAAAVDRAVQAASAAQPRWQALAGFERAKFLYALARELQKHARLLAVLETLDNGKPIRESRDLDVPLAIRHFYHHAGWASLLAEEFPNQQALGVAAQIIPWNFPLLLLAWKVAPALATGNTVVLKPAEQTPLTALWFAECTQRVGLPAGVFQLLTGAGQVGETLAQHPAVNKIAFTGSTAVGKRLRELTAASPAPLTLELGGTSPFLVLADADLDSAVEGVVEAIGSNQGEGCCAGSRLLLQESIATRFVAKLKTRMSRLRVGNPLDKAIDLGALVSEAQRQRVQSYLTQGQAEGLEMWQPALTLPAQGAFCAPILVCNVDPASALAQEELCGPVAVTQTFRTPQEAVQLANNTRNGLAASIWTENGQTAAALARQLKVGVVWINSTNRFDAACGFGGYRESGVGREGGREGLLEYLRPRTDGRREPPLQRQPAPAETPAALVSEINRTAKLYIGGAQVRPDSGLSLSVWNADGSLAGEVGQGTRKDIRNAVEAAHKAASWSQVDSHLRAQILYFIAENLSIRRLEFQARLQQLTGSDAATAAREVSQCLERCFTYAAWADKFEGAVHQPPAAFQVIAQPEPLGVLGVICPEHQPMLSLLSLLLPALALGNRVVLVPSRAHALVATDLVQVFETSDIPAGAVNVITGDPLTLVAPLAAHEDVQGIWVFGAAEEVTVAKRESVGNLKRVWSSEGQSVDWSLPTAQGREFLRQASQIKNIWMPYGV